MTLSLGQRGCVNSARRIVPSGERESKSFDAFSDVNSLTFDDRLANPLRMAEIRSDCRPERDQSSWIVTVVIATGSSGRSFALRGAATIASTTSIPFVTWPKSV